MSEQTERLHIALQVAGYWPAPEQAAEREPSYLRQHVHEVASELSGEHLVALTWVATALFLLGQEGEVVG